MKTRCLASVITLLFASNVVLGQTGEILQMIPEDTLGFVIVQRLDKIDKEMTALAKKMGEPLPDSPLAQIKHFFGINRALNESGASALLLLSADGLIGNSGEADAAWIVPVRKYETLLKELKAQEGQDKIAKATLPNGFEVLVARLPTFRNPMALITPATHRQSLEKILNTKHGPAKEMQSLQKWLTEADGAAVMLSAGMKLCAGLVAENLGQLKANLDPTDPNQKESIAALETGLQVAESVKNNVTYIGVGGNLNNAGNLHFGIKVGFRTNGDYAKAIKAWPTIKGGPLAGLPGDPYFMAMGFDTPKSLMQSMVGWFEQSIGAQKDKITAGERRAAIGFLRSYLLIERMSLFVGRPTKESPNLYENIVGMVTVSDAGKLLDAYEQYGAAWQEVSNKLNPTQAAAFVTVQRDKNSNIPTLRAKYKLLKVVDPNNKQPIKYTATLAAIDKNTVLITTKPVKDVAKFVKDYQARPTLANKPDVKKIAGRLPADTRLFMLADASFLAQMIAASPAEPFGLKQINELPEFSSIPPAGFGIAVSPAGVEAEYVVPIRFLEEYGDYLRKLKKQRDKTK